MSKKSDSDNRRMNVIKKVIEGGILPDKLVKMNKKELVNFFHVKEKTAMAYKRLVDESINPFKTEKTKLQSEKRQKIHQAKTKKQKEVMQKRYEKKEEKFNQKAEKRRKDIVKSYEKTVKKQTNDKSIIDTMKKSFHEKINSIFETKSKNKKFTNIVNDLVDKFGMDRDKAIKEAHKRLRTPKKKKPKKGGKGGGGISWQIQDIVDEWSPIASIGGK